MLYMYLLLKREDPLTPRVVLNTLGTRWEHAGNTLKGRMEWNCGHRCYNRNLSSCKLGPRKDFGATTGFEPATASTFR